jgi:UDP-N-acetylmuramoylalanine--D-glutamate ligase
MKIKQKAPSGRHVLVIGAARQGMALARYLARHQYPVILNDKRSEHELAAEIKSLKTLEVEWLLGSHSPSLLKQRPAMVCVSGGVPLDNEMVQYALRESIPLSNDTQVFMDLVPCKTIAITGSAGKTTTTTLLGRMALAEEGKKYRRVWVGGNIGDPLINYLDEIEPDDLAIMEISSFQSELMTRSTDIAMVLNITPNHLDRHGTMKAYVAAKARLVQYQRESSVTILGRDDSQAWKLQKEVKGKLYSFGFNPLPAGMDGMTYQDGTYYWNVNGVAERIPMEEVLELRGDHNKLNAMAAASMAKCAGLQNESILAGIRGFKGVSHRLEIMVKHKGVTWINDSIATAPERTMAAINAFDGPLVLMLGGRDKKLPWNDLAALIHKRVCNVVLFGEAASLIERSLKESPEGSILEAVYKETNLENAVATAYKIVRSGETVLFSPGGTSYDEFKDFSERGERLKQWLQAHIDKNP